MKQEMRELESRLLTVKQNNIDLEAKVKRLEAELEEIQSKKSEDELIRTIQDLKKIKKEMESQMNFLQKELEETKMRKVREKEDEVEFLVEQFEKERASITQSYEKIISDQKKDLDESNLDKIEKENEKLRSQIGKMSEEIANIKMKSSLEENNEVLKEELSMLKMQYRDVSQTVSEIQNQDRLEMESLMKENLNLKKEINEMKIKLLKEDTDVPNFKLELSHVLSENTNIKSQMYDLKKQIQLLNETRNKEKQLLMEYKLINNQLQEQVRRMSSENSKCLKTEGTAKKKREIGKEDEEAWKNLYGIKHVEKREIRSSLSSENLLAGTRLQLEPVENVTTLSNGNVSENIIPKSKVNVGDQEGDDKNYERVQNLEKELEKARDEILKQKLELKLKLGEDIKFLELRRNSELIDMKRQLVNLQKKLTEENSLRNALEGEIFKINLELKDKARLEGEVSSLKKKIDRDLVGRGELEVLKAKSELKNNKSPPDYDVYKISDDLRVKCESLAKEKEKCHELRVKNLIRKSISLEPAQEELPFRRGKYHSYPFETTEGVRGSVPMFEGIYVPRTTISGDWKSMLVEELDNSIRRHTKDNDDVPNRTRTTLEATTTAIQMDLLKKKYLC